MQPAFHRERIESYGQIMVESTLQMLQAWQNGQVRNLPADMGDLTLRIVCKCLFRRDVGGRSVVVGEGLNAVRHFNTRGRVLLPLAGKVPTPAYIRYRCAIQRLDAFIYALTDSRRSQPTSSFDLHNLLLEGRDDQGESMSGQQLRDEVITLILAGHETTALALNWTLYLLSRKPKVEAKLLAEIGQVTGGNPPSVDKLPLLPYTAAVITEAQCLYPPAYAVPRQALEDVAIGGYLVPRGSSVVFSPWVIHRDERFFPEPHRFYPER